jgi:hypothetical protein
MSESNLDGGLYGTATTTIYAKPLKQMQNIIQSTVRSIAISSSFAESNTEYNTAPTII